MATKINFTHEGKDYCLEYTRQTVKTMEERGFKIGEVLEYPTLNLPALFAGAFLANHKFTDRKVIDAIYDKMKDKRVLVETLSKMYSEPIEALMADGDEGNGIEWTTT